MSDTFHLKIIAYDKIFFSGEAKSIIIPAIDGDIQILPNHEEYVIAIKEGDLRITAADGTEIPSVCGSGFAEITSDNIVEILVDTVEKPEEIDVRRAREAKERAEEKLRQKQSIQEYHRSTASLARAMARIKEASKYSR